MSNSFIVSVAILVATLVSPVCCASDLRTVIQTYQTNPIPSDLANLTRSERFDRWLQRVNQAAIGETDPSLLQIADIIRLSLLNGLGRHVESLSIAESLGASLPSVVARASYDRETIEIANFAFIATADQTVIARGLAAGQRLRQYAKSITGFSGVELDSLRDSIVTGALFESKLRESAGTAADDMGEWMLYASKIADELLKGAVVQRDVYISQRSECLLSAAKWYIASDRREPLDDIYRALPTLELTDQEVLQRALSLAQNEDSMEGERFRSRIHWLVSERVVRDSPVVCIAIGNAYEKAGQLESAIAAYLRGLELIAQVPRSSISEVAYSAASQCAARISAIELQRGDSQRSLEFSAKSQLLLKQDR